MDKLKPNPDSAKSSHFAWRIVIAGFVIALLLPPAVIGLLTYQAATQRATIERIKKLGADVTVEDAERIDEDASLGKNLLAMCRMDEVAYIEVAAPYAGDLDDLVEAIADLRRVDSLDFRGLNVTDSHILQLSRLRAVTSLDLQGTDVSDAGLEPLVRFQHLKRLDLQCTAISDEAVDLLGRAKALETVNLRNSKVTEAGAQRLRRLLPAADIYCSPAPSDNHWRVVRELLKRGVYVNVRGKYLRDADGIRVHSNFGHPWAGFDWDKLVQIEGLKEASLAEIDTPATALDALACCPQLQMLSLTRVNLDQRTLGRIADCNLLRDVRIGNCHVDSGALSQLSKLKNLEYLLIQKATIEGNSLRGILSLGNLRALHLWDCELDNSALAQVSPPHSLEELVLWRSKINDEGLLGVMRWPTLVKLDASWTRVTGATLDQIEHPSPNLKSIELLETDWTDEGMRQLSRWKNLQELRIVGTKVTEASTEAIRSLRQLKKMALPDSLTPSDAKTASDSTP